jgi:hypothetical protein
MTLLAVSEKLFKTYKEEAVGMYIPILVLDFTVYHMPVAVGSSNWSLIYVTY